MKDSKLLEILSGFTPKELKKLKLMTDSPYFNKEESVRALMDFLLQYAPGFNHPKLDYNHAFRRIFGNRPIQSDPQTAVSKVMSKLMTVVREFMVQEELARNEVQKNLYQAQFFSRKGLLHYTSKLLEEGNDMLESSPFRDEKYFRDKLLLESEWTAYINVVRDKSHPDYNLGKLNRSLDAYYALQKLHMFCYAKNAQLNINIEFDYSQKAYFQEWIQDSGLLEDASIRIWFQAIMLLNEPGPERHQQLKQSIRQEAMKLSPLDLRVLFSYLTNTARKVFKDRHAYFRAMFELYKEQLELDILHVNGYLSPMIFRNIAVVGLKLQEFDWVQQFIDKKADKIFPDHLERDDVVTLCRAYLHFEKKEFHESLEMVNRLRYDNIYIKMDERRMRLMCYFELQMQWTFEDLIHSFRKFLTDHKKRIPPNYLEDNRLFIHFIHKLASDQLDTRENRLALADEIRQVPVLPEKEWLLAKLEGE